jgi:phosphatidylserine decarboxylase
MSIPHSIRDAIPVVHREGYPFIGATVAAAVLVGLFWQPGFWILLAIAGWMVIFFRDPDRVVPTAPGLVVSPADGRIEPVVQAVPPPELELGEEPRTRVSVFMNVFDCHINRAPVAGTVKRIAYRPGKFFNADLDKASVLNERNSVIFQLPDGTVLPTVQIAGLVARRILCWTGEGKSLARGERFGMIRFGSRLDVYLPEGAEVTVLAGQRAVAGETVIARLPGADWET